MPACLSASAGRARALSLSLFRCLQNVNHVLNHQLVGAIMLSMGQPPHQLQGSTQGGRRRRRRKRREEEEGRGGGKIRRRRRSSRSTRTTLHSSPLLQHGSGRATEGGALEGVEGREVSLGQLEFDVKTIPSLGLRLVPLDLRRAHVSRSLCE